MTQYLLVAIKDNGAPSTIADGYVYPDEQKAKLAAAKYIDGGYFKRVALCRVESIASLPSKVVWENVE